jgi:hypothetical protein
MNLYQVERNSQDMAVDLKPGNTVGFQAKLPTGPVVLLWLDPFMGMLQIPGRDGFFMTRQLDEAYPTLECDPPKVYTEDEIGGIKLVYDLLGKTAEAKP